jgi:hypothetical protein
MPSSQLQTKMQVHFHVYDTRLFQSYIWNPICTILITCPKKRGFSQDYISQNVLHMGMLMTHSCTLSHLWKCVCIPFLALCLICENVFVSQDTISITSSHALALVMSPRLRWWQDRTSHWILVGLHGKGPILWTMQISCQYPSGLFNCLSTCINFVKTSGNASNSFNTWDHLLLGEILNLPSNLEESSLEVHYVRFSS